MLFLKFDSCNSLKTSKLEQTQSWSVIRDHDWHQRLWRRPCWIWTVECFGKPLSLSRNATWYSVTQEGIHASCSVQKQEPDVRWTDGQWRSVLWSDESTVQFYTAWGCTGLHSRKVPLVWRSGLGFWRNKVSGFQTQGLTDLLPVPDI